MLPPHLGIKERTTLQMSETVTDSELGRSKKSSSPSEHLQHLLNIGWQANSPLIQKYVVNHRLQTQLAEWEAACQKKTDPKLESEKK
jgi:hypothetical protein